LGVILDRPPLNIVTMAEREELRAVFEAFDTDARIRVVVVRVPPDTRSASWTARPSRVTEFPCRLSILSNDPDGSSARPIQHQMIELASVLVVERKHSVGRICEIVPADAGRIAHPILRRINWPELVATLL
jgi:hypothetical protein